MSQRTERVDELLRQEIGALLTKEIADPRIGFATITEVETAPDLRHAKVWVSVIGGPADRDETLRALAQAMPFIRHELGKRLRIKRIPALHVRLDDSAERGTRVLHLLQDLEAGIDPNEIEPYDESLPTPVKRLHHEGATEGATEGAAEGAAGEAADVAEPVDPASDFGAAAAAFLPPPGKPVRRRTGGPKGVGTGRGPGKPGGRSSRPSSGRGGKR